MNQSTELQSETLSPKNFPKILRVLEHGIEKSVAPGMVAGFWIQKEPEKFYVYALGNRRLVPSEQSMREETVFDLASLTKVIATATLFAKLVERGWVQWDQPVASVLEEFKYKDICFSHLLSHCAGYEAWLPFYEKVKGNFLKRGIKLYQIPIKERQAEMRRLVFNVKPEKKPGERTLYSDLSFLTIGFAIEEITQLPFDKAVRRLLWNPMGMQQSFFARITKDPKKSALKNVAATEESSKRGGVLQGQVHDDNCWAMGGYAGHAGAFGTIRDVLFFSKRLMERELSEKVLNEMWAPILQPSDSDRTMGWMVPSAKGSSAGKYFSKNSVGELGFSGTSLWIDRDAGLAVALLTNRVHPSRENTKIKEFRPKFHDVLRIELKKVMGI